MTKSVRVHLSEHISERLATATKSSGATRSALVEAALDQFLGEGGKIQEPSVESRLNAISAQLELLGHDLRVVSEVVALQARFHLATTPVLSSSAQRAACRLGSARFDEFAAQVEARVQAGRSLIGETIERARAQALQTGSSEDNLVNDATVVDIESSPAIGLDEQPDRLAAAADRDGPHGSESIATATNPAEHLRLPRHHLRRQPAERALPHWLLILRVFLPFVAAYFLSFLFRTVNGTIAEQLLSEFHLGADDLGLLTSIYFLVFAAAQIPIGILLDRYGPRPVQGLVLLAAAAGAGLFAVSESFWLLLAGRALIGLGVAAALTAGLQAVILWFASERVPLLNGVMIMLAGLGAAAATVPAEYVLVAIGWRGLFKLLAIASAVCAVAILLVVPSRSLAPARGGRSLGLKTVYADPRFWRLAPLSASCIGTAWALQGLWAARWFADVERIGRPELLWNLLIMALASSLSALILGIMVQKLRKLDISPRALLGFVALIFFLAQLAVILRIPLPSCLPWGLVAAVSTATVLSYAVLAELFPKELAGRANAALNVFHIGCAFVVQAATGLVVQHWNLDQGHYPEAAYQTAFAINLAVQVAAWLWFLLPMPRKRATCAAS
ncbi:MFS transporter [Bradyrhizobium sp. SZCCHNRI1003]|uniref:MFS transporter n=1 Tax=Bradyrhizobium sp. SZCCHNRI1003 TaxID=3057275 RepID=UPI002915F782|nr:MFS transporter [Bradyrhizobium sp. SZCCHNRI1003]